MRTVADEQAGNFRSAGFTRLFSMLSAELSDEYFAEIGTQLSTLKFRRGMLISARLGSGNQGTGYVLRQPREQGWRDRLPLGGRDSYSFQVADRDESGMRALSKLQGRGTNLVANATAQSADHMLSFFRMLRAELAFYVGCLNVHDRLTGLGEPVCFPVPLPPGQPDLSAQGLYDACLALHTGTAVVGNDVAAGGRSLIMITGANQGGKSTFLRSAGLAQLMMQAGMFVAAREFRADVRDGVFTHYKREEDASMRSGKLDEELSRMSRIVDQITAGLPAAVQRVVRLDQRARGLRDRPADHPGAAGARRQGAVRHPPVRPGPVAATSRTWRPRCSCAPNGRPTGSGRSASPRERRCRPATARTCTSASSPRIGTGRQPAERWPGRTPRPGPGGPPGCTGCRPAGSGTGWTR